jgi:uncharacterized protein
VSAMRGAKSSHLHLVETAFGPHLLVVDGSRLYAIDPQSRAEVEKAVNGGEPAVRDLLARFGMVSDRPYIGAETLADPPLRSLSLAIAQRCNLACSYCYAQGGAFGGEAKAMPWPVAAASVKRLIEECPPGERVFIGFLGGEPLTHRALLRRTTEYATELAERRGISVGFAITTNGTLLRPDDAAFFRRHRFAVTVSLDGVAGVHDRLRPFKGGRGSYQRILDRLEPLFQYGQHLPVFARVTVTPRNLGLREMLDQLIALGFRSVGFSPMLAAPNHMDELTEPDLEVLLGEMTACGREFERQVTAGRHYPFANMLNAMEEIHRGTHRPYPCGAGAGYFGVSAAGGLFACHRFVDDATGALGDVASGIDRNAQRRWLTERMVDRQEPCRGCWARYLCGGGCHHEVIYRGRPACDLIRGWLDYCLQAYVNLSERRPDFFAAFPNSDLARG